MGNARGGLQRPEIFEGVNKTFREREPHGEIGPYNVFVLKEVMATFPITCHKQMRCDDL